MELKIDAAKWRSKRGMGRLLDALGAGEQLTRYVGGSVRDKLLNLPISDVDLATRLRPEDVLQRLEAAKIRAIRSRGSPMKRTRWARRSSFPPK